MSSWLGGWCDRAANDLPGVVYVFHLSETPDGPASPEKGLVCRARSWAALFYAWMLTRSSCRHGYEGAHR
jgi:hypothetical protein